MSEKWVAVRKPTDEWSEIEEVVGIFDSQEEAKASVNESYWYTDSWSIVRIQRPEWDKWA